MDKRTHIKRSSSLSFRHYIYHFKWTLFVVIIIFIFIPLLKVNYVNLSSNTNYDVNTVFDNVIYPTLSEQNKSILCYFIKKDQLKQHDDKISMEKKQKIVLPFNFTNKDSKRYVILEYTPVFGRPRFCSYSQEKIFGSQCPHTNCKYTCEEKDEKVADVLLMHKRDLNYVKLDKIERNPEQIWLLWHDESNENSPNINKYKFNWTMTYRSSAEASLGAYGITIPKMKPWSIDELNTWIDKQFTERYNQAVWLVSNCRPMKRLNIFRSLRQYFPIVAFGRCISPNESLSLNAYSYAETKCSRQSSCEQLSLTTSKFYLAFESQTCTDYITEKFWRTLSVGAIPIVSGPKRENFERIAPPNSFIHVDDYSSVEDLANALNKIANNRFLFGKYHLWKRYYDVYYEAKDLDPYRFCELCYRLNINNKRIWYENVNDWFLESC